MNDTDKPTEDHILIALQHVLSGDRDAFRVIVNTYQDILYRYCLARTGNEDQAKDLVQETFIRAYRSLSTFKLGKKFGPWIFAIASNVLRTSWKRIKQDQNRVPQLFYPDDPEQNNPETEAVQSEANAELERTLRRLPHDLYEVLYLYYYEGLPVAEIANTLSIGEENVKSRLFRGRKKIRSLLQPAQPKRGIRY